MTTNAQSAVQHDPSKGTGGAPKKQSHSTTITQNQQENDLYESVRDNLLSGVAVMPHRYSADQRQALIGIIAALRDQLPIKASWTTLWTFHLSETRLRARCYRIDGAYLREVDNG